MERRPVRFIEPVAGVKWQKLQFRTIGQICRLVDEKAPGVDTCLRAVFTTT